jgi:hypothetical protein
MFCFHEKLMLGLATERAIRLSSKVLRFHNTSGLRSDTALMVPLRSSQRGMIGTAQTRQLCEDLCA